MGACVAGTPVFHWVSVTAQWQLETLLVCVLCVCVCVDVCSVQVSVDWSIKISIDNSPSGEILILAAFLV